MNLGDLLNLLVEKTNMCGLPCAIYHQIPAVYYLSARFKDDFESAVLSAVNGGGQNMARPTLTETLVGA